MHLSLLYALQILVWPVNDGQHEPRGAGLHAPASGNGHVGHGQCVSRACKASFYKNYVVKVKHEKKLVKFSNSPTAVHVSDAVLRSFLYAYLIGT